MSINFNIGLLGHVDSGKTTLARALSTIASTAAFDKNPQSKERGITLDLGFSAALIDAPPHISALDVTINQLQLTFVDCPGHGSLIRTIIGGAQIIDLIILVVDAQKGVQTQTAECLVIAELLKRKLIVAINKIDLVSGQQLIKLKDRLQKVFGRTAFGSNVPIFSVSGHNNSNMEDLLSGIATECYLPKRNLLAPLVVYVDHCFSIKGQGTVCTGTVMQGQLSVNDNIEIPLIREQRKVKGMQIFHKPVQRAVMGDRVGVCVTQFNAKSLERGIISSPNYLQLIYSACILLKRISYYKFPIKSNSKLHITVGHDTVMSSLTLFRGTDNTNVFDIDNVYEFIDALHPSEQEEYAVFALLEFEKPVFAMPDAILIASKLDVDSQINSCRLAFWGRMQWMTYSTNYTAIDFPKFRIYKQKEKIGHVLRLVNEREVIVQNLFKKEANRDLYIGKSVKLSTGEVGLLSSTFGQTSKVRAHFPTGLSPETIIILQQRPSDISVMLKYKKYIFSKLME